VVGAEAAAGEKARRRPVRGFPVPPAAAEEEAAGLRPLAETAEAAEAAPG